MKSREYNGLMAELEAAYRKRLPKSAQVGDLASRYMVDGVNHTLRFVHPFPPRITSASGAYVEDEDGHRILDFWQGHFANILGHNPRVITQALSRAFAEGFGLQTGYADRLQAEAAEIFCRQTGSERVRFTTSGALATMYSILLARAFTGREKVMKVGGGWHGANPWGLKGVTYRDASAGGYHHVESAGLPAAVADDVVITRYNDPERLHEDFRKHGDKLACFILEPFIGNGGMMPARPEYLQEARALTERFGVVLIIDEVIAGFRFRAGSAAQMYGIQPDLSTFGKIMGGGMPVAAVGGKADILGLTARTAKNKVSFSGGTYSAHPSSLLAAKTMMHYLVEHETEIYPRIAMMGDQMRSSIESSFADAGIDAYCTGHGNDALAGGSLIYIHFPYQEGARTDRPDELFNPALHDTVLGDQVMHLAFLLEDVHLLHGHGSVSSAHGESEVARLKEASRNVARKVKKYL